MNKIFSIFKFYQRARTFPVLALKANYLKNTIEQFGIKLELLKLPFEVLDPHSNVYLNNNSLIPRWNVLWFCELHGKRTFFLTFHFHHNNNLCLLSIDE